MNRLGEIIHYTESGERFNWTFRKVLRVWNWFTRKDCQPKITEGPKNIEHFIAEKVDVSQLKWKKRPIDKTLLGKSQKKTLT